MTPQDQTRNKIKPSAPSKGHEGAATRKFKGWLTRPPTHLLAVYKTDQRVHVGRIFLAHAARIRQPQ
jgi:hypothetical protein